jgi:hydroxymethylpyrimidine pyrophosphatase-like HAD family hydrolase
MIKLIVMDGTLLNDEKNITDHTAAILEEYRAVGIKTAIATARSEKSATMTAWQDGSQRIF